MLGYLNKELLGFQAAEVIFGVGGDSERRVGPVSLLNGAVARQRRWENWDIIYLPPEQQPRNC